jgi:peptidoglycan-associated lipoprotein
MDLNARLAAIPAAAAFHVGNTAMRISSNHLGLACLVAVLALGACTTKKPEMVTTATPRPAAAAQMPAPATSSILPGSRKDFSVNVGDTVHFAYDEYNIEATDKAILQRQAAWLQKYPMVRVTIEGHCDERGTREYNLALGARRANAVKDYLAGSGVSMARLDTISYGKERPICTESNESCWAQNRRGVTTITSGTTDGPGAAVATRR